MNTSNFAVAVQTTLNALTVSAENALNAKTLLATQTTASDADKKTAYKTHKNIETKIKYVSLMNNEHCAKKCAQFVKSDAMLNEVIQDSYSVDKFAITCKALTMKSKSTFSADTALFQAIAYLVATDFKEVTHDELRKNLFSKTDSSKMHETDRQSSMICKLFERLDVAERTKLNDKKATKFNKESALIKAISALFD